MAHLDSITLKLKSIGLGGPGKEYRASLRSHSGLENLQLVFVARHDGLEGNILLKSTRSLGRC